MSQPHGAPRFSTVSFEPFEVKLDPRRRVSLARAGVQPGQRYRIEERADGSLVLTPMVSVPASNIAPTDREPSSAAYVAGAL